MAAFNEHSGTRLSINKQLRMLSIFQRLEGKLVYFIIMPFNEYKQYETWLSRDVSDIHLK